MAFVPNNLELCYSMFCKDGPSKVSFPSNCEGKRARRESRDAGGWRERWKIKVKVETNEAFLLRCYFTS